MHKYPHHWRRSLSLIPRSGTRLSSNIGLNGLAQACPLVTNIILTPYLIGVLGPDGFGIWSLLFVLIATLTTLDGGVGASLTRFYAVHAARDDRVGSTRLFIGSLCVFLVAGLVITSVALAFAPAVVSRLHMAPSLRMQTTGMLGWLGPLVTLALASDSAEALLQANGRFLSLANITVASSAIYVVGVVLFTQSGDPFIALVPVTAARYLVILLGGLLAAARHLRLERPLLPAKPVRREFFHYATRMQASSLTSFFNGELDAFVIGALLPIRYVGIYAAGYQVASALRSLPLYAFPPILTRMTEAYARDGMDGAVGAFQALQPRWLPAVFGYGAVATAAASFGVQIWLGPHYLLGGLVAAVLMAGYSVHVGLTGMRTCFVRAVGQPGLETRYSVVITVLNMIFTVPLALLFGMVGVVSATAAALILASLYFMRLCRRLAGLHEDSLSRQWFATISVAALLTVTGEIFVAATPWRGMLGLGMAGIPALLGLGVLCGRTVRRSLAPLAAYHGSHNDHI